MKKFIFTIIVLIVVLFVYSKYYNTYGLTVKEYPVYDSKLPESFSGLKIVHFSDILFKDAKDFTEIQLVIDKINSLNADVIVFTGDLIKSKINDKDKEELQKKLSSLTCNLYKYFITGDNDNEDSIAILQKADFIYLNNNSQLLFNNGQEPILIIGGNKITDESYLSTDNIYYKYIVTLIHKPDNFLSVSKKSTLVLSGHSLGGQIRVPFWGAIIKKDGANTYTDDFYRNDGSQMYVSYGIGTDITPFRLFNKPSINVYRLYAK